MHFLFFVLPLQFGGVLLVRRRLRWILRGLLMLPPHVLPPHSSDLALVVLLIPRQLLWLELLVHFDLLPWPCFLIS